MDENKPDASRTTSRFLACMNSSLYQLSCVTIVYGCITFGVSGRRRAQHDGYQAAATLLGAPLDAGVRAPVIEAEFRRG
jgi:hypothetical protein